MPFTLLLLLLSFALNHGRTAFAAPPVVAEEIRCGLYWAELDFLPAGFKPDEVVEAAHLPPGFADKKPIKVIDLTTLPQGSKPSLEKNGFQKVDIPREDPFFKMLKATSDQPDFFLPENRAKAVALRQAAAKYIEANKDKLGLKFDTAVPVDAVFRDTEAGNNNRFKAISLAHIDFRGAPDDIIKQFPTWQGPIKERLGPEKAEHLLKNANGQTVEIINLWVPIQEGSPTNTLTLADTNTLDKKDIAYYTAVRNNGQQFPSVGMKHSDSQNWYYSSGMQLGDGYVFLSRQTPHGAIDLPDGKKARKSIEFRILLIHDEKDR